MLQVRLEAIGGSGMRKSNFALRLQPSLWTIPASWPETEGVALNQFINVAVAEKLPALRAESYFFERAARAGPASAPHPLKRMLSRGSEEEAFDFEIDRAESYFSRAGGRRADIPGG
jgi:hypothetical protein